MKLFIVLSMAALASAGRLSNNYLPPSGAQHSGGSPGSISAPGVELARSNFNGHYDAYNDQRSQGFNQQGFNKNQGYERQGQGFNQQGQGYNQQAQAYILRQDNDMNEQGYHYAYETSDGTKAEQEGQVFPGQSENEGSISVQGSYSYVGDDGQTYSVRYIADENGFRAEGDHLPTPPPIPQAILRSLQQQEGSNGYGNENHQATFNSNSGYRY